MATCCISSVWLCGTCGCAGGRVCSILYTASKAPPQGTADTSPTPTPFYSSLSDSTPSIGAWVRAESIFMFHACSAYPIPGCRSCWLEIVSGYTSSGGGGAAAYSGSPRTSSSSAAALPPFPDWLLARARRLTGATAPPSSAPSPLQSSADCMCAMFLAQLLVEQQKGGPALKILAQVSAVFPTSQVVLSLVRAHPSASRCVSMTACRRRLRTMAYEITPRLRRPSSGTISWIPIVWSTWVSGFVGGAALRYVSASVT